MQQVRIGCINYKVVDVEGLQDEDGESIYGQVAYDACEIRLLAGLDPQARTATLWHEIVHAILVNAGFVGDHDEQMVSAISHGICAVLSDNKNMVE